MNGAQLAAADALLSKLQSLNVGKLFSDVHAVIKRPTLRGAIEVVEEGVKDAANIIALVPGGQTLAAELALAATCLALLDEVLSLAPLATDLGHRLSQVDIHVPELFAVNHGPTKPLFGEDDGQRVFGFAQSTRPKP